MSALAVPLADAKLHLRVDHDDEDALIEAFILAAAEDAETLTGRAMLTQTWRQRLDALPAGAVDLGPARVTGVVSISYVGADGSAQTLDPLADVQLQADDRRALLWPSVGSQWPATRPQPDAVTITYTCGSWLTPADLPAVVIAWLKLRIGALYENRAAWTSGKPIERNEFVDRLLDRWCIHRL